jgi:hypothetical protein
MHPIGHIRQTVRAARAGDAAAALQCATWGVVLLAVCLAPFLWKPWIHGTDGARNFAYVHSLWIDHDLDFTNEFTHFAATGDYEGDLTPDPVTGRPGTPVGIGSAVLWGPFFLAAHGLARLGLAPTDGYSAPYVWAVCLGSLVYALIGLVLLVRIAARRFGGGAAWAGVVAAWLGSPLVFYMYLHPSMSHACSFFLWALLVWLCERSDWRGRPWHYAILGLLCGLATATRFVDGVCILLPAALWWGRLSSLPSGSGNASGSASPAIRRSASVPALRRSASVPARSPDQTTAAANSTSAESKGSGPRRPESLRRTWRWPGVRDWAGAALAVGGFFVGFLPQMAAWHALHGSWFSGPRDRQVSLTAQLTVLSSPHLWQVLFSGWRGLFVWSPVLLAGAWGWTRLALRRGGQASDRAYAIAFVVQLWVIGGWAQWFGGASFGQRFFIDFVPGFALGLAFVFSRTRRRVAGSGPADPRGSTRAADGTTNVVSRGRMARRLLWAYVAASLLWSGGLAVQYVSGAISRTDPVSIKRLAGNQWRIVPQAARGLIRHLAPAREGGEGGSERPNGGGRR